MYPAAFEYHSPATLKDALGLMGKLGDDAKLLAGGHSLLPMMKLRLAQPKHIIDLRKVPGLAGIKDEGGTLVLGAMTTPPACLPALRVRSSRLRARVDPTRPHPMITTCTTRTL